ncbi:Hexosyltransferase [Rhynchospora pubera]|uniref:Hexosyltransferase n=1 Tax=Rhynchospora pubera TaxID=906938 RepID=A0AAV8C466_9POAL|nr:Hexosyltransferase [Rhynchospora pubera]
MKTQLNRQKGKESKSLIMQFSHKNRLTISKTLLLLLLLLPLCLFSYFFFFSSNSDLQPLFNDSSCNPTKTALNSSLQQKEDLRIFIGILTVPHLHERRHLLRLVYALQVRSLATVKVDVRFVFCRTMNEEQMIFLKLEIMQHNDIIILDCSENLNDGKTYTYFSSLPSMLGEEDNSRPYDYVVKTDDDAYFRLDNLAKFLKDKPRKDLYYGMELGCVGAQIACGANNTFMAGFGYVLSWDLVEWIAKSEIARNNKIGLEDVMLGKWLNEANKGKNRYNGFPNQFYDYKGDSPDDYFRHELVDNTVAVHKLKTNLHWARTLNYFNVTHGLKPSKLNNNILIR